MSDNFLKPKQSLNKAFLKVKPNRSAIESFKDNLIQLIDRINEAESEEFHKNLVTKSLESKKQDPTSETATIEAEIDQFVYGIYGLSEEEIGIVEGGEK